MSVNTYFLVFSIHINLLFNNFTVLSQLSNDDTLGISVIENGHYHTQYLFYPHSNGNKCVRIFLFLKKDSGFIDTQSTGASLLRPIRRIPNE